MTAFSIGQRVIYTKPNGTVLHTGDRGKICYLDLENNTIGVHWDRASPLMHDCDEYCPDNYGWFVGGEHIQVIPVQYDPNQEPEDDCL